MSRINFNNCTTVADIDRLHKDALVGASLVEFDMTTLKWKDGQPYNDEKQLLIFSTSTLENRVLFEVEEEIGKGLLLPFRMGLQVVTSVVEIGDIYWSPDDFKRTNYTIRGLNEDGTAFDDLLRAELSLPINEAPNNLLSTV